MDKLSLLDQMLYTMDRAGKSQMQMAGASIVDITDSPYRMNARVLAEHVAARMERIPLLRKKLVRDPLGIGQLRLVDDPRFSVRNHYSVARLKAPGGYKELTEHLARFSAQVPYREKPLWHYQVIEGLEGGRLAFVFCMDHCIADGVGAVEALSAMWDEKPVPPEKPNNEIWQCKPPPTPYGLLGDALRENAARMFVRTPKYLLEHGAPVIQLLRTKLLTAFRIQKPSEETEDQVDLPKVQKTSLNVRHISDKRVVSYVEFPLHDLKTIRRFFNCTINDLALLLASCSLEHYFNSIGEKVDFDLITMMPISLRGSGEEAQGNIATSARVSLHNTISHIGERLRAIRSDTDKIKRSAKPGGDNKPAIDANELIELFNPLFVDALLQAVIKVNLLDKLPVANLGVTNVPGLPTMIYLAGGKLVGAVPMPPLIDTMGLSISISSTSTHLAMGYHGCASAVKDKEALVEGAKKAFDTLRQLAGLSGTESGPKSKRKSRPRRKATTSNRKARPRTGGV